MRRSGRKAGWAWPLAAALLILGEAPAQAEEPPALAVRITESLHDGCPKTPSMRERIEAHLGHITEAGPAETAIELSFDVRRQGSTSRGTLTLSLSGVSVERTAAAKSCEDVVAALSLMAAVALGEEVERLSSAPAEKPTTPAPEPIPRPRPPKTTKRAPVSPPPRNHLKLSFGTGVEIEANRSAVLMPSWFAQLALPTPLASSLRVGFARTVGVHASSTSGEATLRWTELTVLGCLDLFRSDALRLGPCVNAELGRLEATKIDPLPARRLVYVWPTLGVAGKMTWAAAPGFSVELIAGARAPLIARELFFEPDRDAVVYRAPVVVPFLGVGFVTRAW